ncbi:MAG: ATP-binding protein [Bacteroides sp.]|nr:ATP-binding protein [Bacteroides sp.]
MAHLSIKNIGPIKEIDIELNRINIFIGPQSSGKSTVAKIVSFCQWLEKDCFLHQSVRHVDTAYVKRHLFNYFNMSSYANRKDAMFHYLGDGIEIEYSNENVIVKMKPGFKTMQISKNLYLPSERNVLAIPGIFTTKMPDNYLLDFIDDWQIIRTKYTSLSGHQILDLKESYFFDSHSNSDKLLLQDGDPIPLSESSSGLQSVTPLCILIDYTTDWIYSHEEDKSAYARKRYREAAIIRYLSNKMDNVEALVDDINRTETTKLELLELEHNMSIPAFSNLIVEEPEQNLFPDTQVRLLYYILSKINHSRDSLIITTHSPYILYALNNCMLASKVSGEDVAEVAESIDIPKAAWTDTADVSVWELDNGVIRGNATIQDDKGLIRGNYFDRVMHNVMADFHILIDYSE